MQIGAARGCSLLLSCRLLYSNCPISAFPLAMLSDRLFFPRSLSLSCFYESIFALGRGNGQMLVKVLVERTHAEE